MNKGDLVEAMASDAGISKSQAQLALNSFIALFSTRSKIKHGKIKTRPPRHLQSRRKN